MPGTLFVRSGGGMPGLDIHAGIWLALEQRGIVPTAVCGTSAGAIVSAMQAAGRSAGYAGAVINTLDDSDVRREVFAWKARIPWIEHWLENAPIAALLYNLIPGSFADLKLSLSVWATRLETGEAVDVADTAISPCPAAAALASISIGGVFPPVQLSDGYTYIDGGVCRNLPLPANWRDYDHVWLLIASPRPRDYRRSRGIITNLVRNVHYMMQHQMERVLAEVKGRPSVHVIWPDVHTSAGMLHFDHALVMQAYRYTGDQLDRGTPP